MNYTRIYTELIERSKCRTISEYTERHHIIPRCIGGSDDQSNIAVLTPEEHYVAHQLLVKMYPNNNGVLWAALVMTGHKNGSRCNNKLYGWLRRKYAKAAKNRTGKQNGSYGKPWYHNPNTNEAGKFQPGTEPIGWIRGRCKGGSKCIVCHASTGRKKAKWCEKCQPTTTTKQYTNYSALEQKFKGLINEGHSFTSAMSKLGYTKHWNLKTGMGKWMKQVYENM